MRRTRVVDLCAVARYCSTAEGEREPMKVSSKFDGCTGLRSTIYDMWRWRHQLPMLWRTLLRRLLRWRSAGCTAVSDSAL